MYSNSTGSTHLYKIFSNKTMDFQYIEDQKLNYKEVSKVANKKFSECFFGRQLCCHHSFPRFYQLDQYSVQLLLIFTSIAFGVWVKLGFKTWVKLPYL